METTFKIRDVLFKLMVMLFGFFNAPITFMWMINNVFKPLIDIFNVVYLDYIHI
jgi:hypothetical protein